MLSCPCSSVDTCIDTCTDMCADLCADMRANMCAGGDADMCTDKCRGKRTWCECVELSELLLVLWHRRYDSRRVDLAF